MKKVVTNVMQWLWNNQYLMMTPDELVELTDECITSCGGENGLLPHVSNSLPDFEFAEWLGRNYIRMNKVWCHRYVDQRDEKNWKTSQQLYDFWINGGNDC